MSGVSFGEKLNHLKSMFHVTDREIGTKVGAVTSLVCRWRSGERHLDRYQDAHTVEELGSFFIEQAQLRQLKGEFAWLLEVDEGAIELENPTCLAAFAGFLYDGKVIPSRNKTAKTVVSSKSGANYIGFQGVMDALASLEELLRETSEVQVCVYLSLEFSQLLLEEEAYQIWERLYAMNRHAPVRVVFDGWLNDSEMVSQNLRALLPFMQTGKIELHLIKAVEKYFYHNLTFFAKGLGLVITTEPVAGLGNPISLLIHSQEYVGSMGEVFAGFDRKSKSLAKHFSGGGGKEEAIFYKRLFEPKEDMQFLYGGVNLLYLDEASYVRLLELNHINVSQRNYRHKKFVENKQKFEEFLAKSRLKEIINLSLLDDMLLRGIIETPDFSFFEGEIQGDKEILAGLLKGMLQYMERYENLSIYLERNGERTDKFSCKIKGDSFLLLHVAAEEEKHTIYSDNWMLVYEYIKQFQEKLLSTELINTRHGVKTALQLRLEGLKGIEGLGRA